MAAKQRKDGTEATGGLTRFLEPSSQTPCPAGARWRACRPARIVAPQLLLALTVLTASPALAQTTHAGTRDSESEDGWAPAEDSKDISVHAVEATSELLPKITITASRDPIYGGLEDMRFVLERDQAGDSMTVKLWLHQDEDWLNRRTQTRYVYFYPNETTAVLRVHRSQFNPAVTRIGCIIAKVLEVSGKDYSSKKVRAGVWVISSPDPLMKLFVGREVFTDAEDAGQLSGTHVVAVMADGLPRGVSLTARIGTRGKGSQPGLTATPGEDYEPNIRAVRIDESSFRLFDDTWVGGGDFVVPILDDNLREGDETFEIILEPDPELSGLVRYEQVHEWTECGGSGCAHRVNIIDDEEMPAMNLSVSEHTIMEEGETSSTAMVSITDGVRFADEQMVTLALGGTATMGADYTVSPADADRGLPDHQVVLPARSTSAEVTLRAMSDEVDDPGEMIEVSAALNGDAIGHMQAIEIMNQEMAKPKITLAANRETIIGSMEDLVLTLTREGSFGDRLPLTIEVLQDQQWLPWSSCPAAFEAGAATASVTVPHDAFSTSVVESGHLTLRVRAVDGYDTDNATVTVYVVSQEGPAVRVFFDQDTYEFAEDDKDATVVLVAEAAHGMPRGTAVAFSLASKSGTAIGGEDFQSVSRQMTLREEDYSFQDGSWQVRRRMPVTLFDDQVREGDETCDLVLGSVRGSPSDLGLRAVTPVDITDDEDIPEMSLRLSANEIDEEGETSAAATVAITNGKVFATDQAVTFRFGGSATHGTDYKVSPADADRSAPGHQVALSAGARSLSVTIGAKDDDVDDPNEHIEISVTHAGHAIGSGSIHIRNHAPPAGPTVKVVFDEVRPTQDPLAKWAATGPFVARFTFSEPVRHFAQENVDWGTQAETTVDGTPIGVHLWDFTEVRRGVEYSVRIMPTQNGVLWIGVDPGEVNSVATGAGNQHGASSVRIEFPPNRLLVAPGELTVNEGDAQGADFLVVVTSAPTGAVTVATSGTEGTQVKLDQPTLEVPQEYWNSARGVTVTGGVDADRKDETVTLTVAASGGGYDRKSAEVVITVRDNQSGGSSDIAGDIVDEASDLILVEGVSPEAAAAALFGETGLSEAQLAAFDRLGNRNGAYDLGDVLSWIERCGRGEASCGAPSSGASKAASGAAALAAAGPGSRSSRRRRQDSGSGQKRSARQRRGGTAWWSRRRVGGPSRWHSSGTLHGLALLLAATITWGCAEDFVQPPVEPDPGALTVWLTTPNDGGDSGAMLVLEGPGIAAVQAPGLEVFQSGDASSKRIILAGTLTTGPVLEIEVPDRTLVTRYRVELLQVAGGDYTLRDLSSYGAMIMR